MNKNTSNECFNIRSNFQRQFYVRLINCHFHLFFFRQFDNFELNDQINIFSSNENFEFHQINFTFFVNSIVLSQWSNQYLFFFVFFLFLSSFFFFVFFFRFFLRFFFLFVNDSFEFMIRSAFFFQSKTLNVIKSASSHDEKSRRQTIKQNKTIWVKLYYTAELKNYDRLNFIENEFKF